MHDDVLRVDVSHVEDVTWVMVKGEIDASTALTLRATLEQLGIQRRIVVDMAGVEFMDSSGLKVLLTQKLRMMESDGEISICNPSDAIHRLLEVTGLREILLESEPSP